MQIPITSQAEYDNAVKSRQHVGNELVLQNCSEVVEVKTDVTIGNNGRCKTNDTTHDKSPVTITVKENGALAAGGKTTIIGHDNANIIAKGHCKVTLHDTAIANCFDHCHIDLKGQSKTAADGNCTVKAYDESLVSATGNTKVYAYQDVTAQGSGISSILANGNCVIHAKESCSVQAHGSCLIIAEENAKILSHDSCLVMSNGNPKITVTDQCQHINLDKVNGQNIKETLKQMAQTSAISKRMDIAIDTLKEKIPQQEKQNFNNRLNVLGLKDKTAIKNYLNPYISEQQPAQSQISAQNLQLQLELAHKAGYVQGVCECVAVVGEEKNLGKKLLTEMSVTKDMAKKYASPETYKTFEQGIFAQQQTLERTQGIKR